MIVRGAKPTVTTHNLIRGQWVATGVMQTQIPVFNCPSRRPRVVREQDGNSVTEGIASDYGVNYGSGTSTAENDNGAFNFSCGPCANGKGLAELTDGPSNTLLVGREARHPDGTRAIRRRHRRRTGLQHLLVAAVEVGVRDRAEGRDRFPAGARARRRRTPTSSAAGTPASCCSRSATGRVRGLKTSTSGSVLALLSARGDGQVIPE